MASPVITLQLNARDRAGPTIRRMREDIRGLGDDLNLLRGSARILRGLSRGLESLESVSVSIRGATRGIRSLSGLSTSVRNLDRDLRSLQGASAGVQRITDDFNSLRAASTNIRSVSRNANNLRNAANNVQEINRNLNTLQTTSRETDSVLRGLFEGLGFNIAYSLQEAGLGVLRFAADTVRAFGVLEGITEGFTATLKSVEAATAAVQNFREIAELPGIDFSNAISFGNILQGVGIDARRINSILIETGNLIALSGLGRDELYRGLLAIQQILTRGRFEAEERNQLIEAIPLFAGVIQDAFGTLDTETISGRIGEGRENVIRNFLDPLISELSTRGRASADQINNLIANQRNFLVFFQQELGRVLEPFARDILRASQTILQGGTALLRGVEGITTRGVSGGARNLALGGTAVSGILLSGGVRGAIEQATAIGQRAAGTPGGETLAAQTQASNTATLERLRAAAGRTGPGARAGLGAAFGARISNINRSVTASLQRLGPAVNTTTRILTRFSGVLTAVSIGLDTVNFLSLRGELNETRGSFDLFTRELTRFATQGEAIRVVNRQISDLTATIRAHRQELGLAADQEIPEETFFGFIRDITPFIGTGGRRTTRARQLRIEERDLQRLQERRQQLTPATGEATELPFRRLVQGEVARLRQIRRRPQEVQAQIERLEQQRDEISDAPGGIANRAAQAQRRREVRALENDLQALRAEQSRLAESASATESEYRSWNNLLREFTMQTEESSASLEKSTTQVRDLGRALRNITADDPREVIGRNLQNATGSTDLEGVSQQRLDNLITSITQRLTRLNDSAEEVTDTFGDLTQLFDATNITDTSFFTQLEEQSRPLLETLGAIRRRQAEIVQGVDAGAALPFNIERGLQLQQVNDAIDVSRQALEARQQAINNNTEQQINLLQAENQLLENSSATLQNTIRTLNAQISRLTSEIQRSLADEAQVQTDIQTDLQRSLSDITPRGRSVEQVREEINNIDRELQRSIEAQRGIAIRGITIPEGVTGEEAEGIRERETERINRQFDRAQEQRQRRTQSRQDALTQSVIDSERRTAQERANISVQEQRRILQNIENTADNRARIEAQTTALIEAERQASLQREDTIANNRNLTEGQINDQIAIERARLGETVTGIEQQTQERINGIRLTEEQRVANLIREIRIRELEEPLQRIQFTGGAADALQIPGIRRQQEQTLANLEEIQRIRVEGIEEAARLGEISEAERAARVREVDQQINSERTSAINDSLDQQLQAIESIRAGFVSLGNTLYDTLVTGPIRQQRLLADLARDQSRQIEDVREDPNLDIEEQERRIFEIKQRFAEREQDLNQEVARSRIDSALNAGRIVVNTALETFSRIAAIRASESLLGLAPASNVGIAGALGTLGLGASLGGIGAIVAGIALTGLLVNQSRRFHDPINDLVARSGGREIARELITNERQSARDYVRETNAGIKQEVQRQQQRDAGQSETRQGTVMAVPVQSLQDLIIATSGATRRELEAFEMIPVG